MRPGYSWHSSSTSAGRSTAAVPTTTRSTPASSSSQRRLGRPHAAARPRTLQATLRARSRRICSRWVRVAGAGGVEVDHVDPLRAGGLELARDAHRVVVVDGLGVEVALVQAHAVAVAQVDGGIEVEAHARSTSARGQSVPLVDGTPVPSTFTASRSARATPLNDASITWWPFLPDSERMCSVMPAPNDERPPELLGELRIEGADPLRRPDRPRTRGTAGPTGRARPAPAPRRAARATFAKRRTPRLVAQRLLERGAEHDADVFDGVVEVDLEVARASMREVEAAVLPELLEHVVEERDAGGRRRGAAAVDVEHEVDRRLLRGRGAARDVRAIRTATSWSELRSAARKASFSSGVPMVTRRQSLEAGPAREVAHEHALVDQLLPAARGRRRRARNSRKLAPDGYTVTPSMRGERGGDPLALVDQALRRGRPSRRRTRARAAGDLGGDGEVVRQHHLLELVDHPRAAPTAKPRRSAAIDHTFE